jgi:hypothetical protein
VAGVVDDVPFGAGKGVPEGLPRGERDPRVLAAPDDGRRDVEDLADRRVQGVVTAVAQDREQTQVVCSGAT